MHKFGYHELYGRLRRLWDRTNEAAVACGPRKKRGHVKLTAPERKALKELAHESIRLCQRFHLRSGPIAFDLHKFATARKGTVCARRDTWEKLDRLQAELERDLSEKFFVDLAPDRVSILIGWQHERLLENVKAAFGDAAAYDLGEAIECYLADINTACVIHLMRAAEHGLRALAWDRRIRLQKNKPIELAQWGELLRELGKKTEEMERWPRTKAREEQLNFYHSALMELQGFKNIWRNPAAHARASYGPNQALNVLTHVSAFMRTLASKISSTSRTPKRWTSAQL